MFTPFIIYSILLTIISAFVFCFKQRAMFFVNFFNLAFLWLFFH